MILTMRLVAMMIMLAIMVKIMMTMMMIMMMILLRMMIRFVKIFLVLGFTWTAEVISTALAAEHGWQETFYVGLLLDLVNLFLGVLLFVFLVCNKSVYLEGRARILGRTLSSDHDPDEMTM